MERPPSDKNSSVLQTFINYGRKKFYNIGTWLGNKMMKSLPLRIQLLRATKTTQLKILVKKFKSSKKVFIELMIEYQRL
jgi:hypothetical protein